MLLRVVLRDEATEEFERQIEVEAVRVLLLDRHATAPERERCLLAGKGGCLEVASLESLFAFEDRRKRHPRPCSKGSPEFPETVISIAIEPKTTADMDRLSQSLGRLAQEDPSFRVTVDEETGQTIIGGMGELHLEIIVDRLLREFKVDANVGQPQVAYKETITAAARARGPLHQAVRRLG